MPTGIVTLLFTDIVGSSQRWDRDASAMRVAIDRHDLLIGDAIDRHRGHLVKKLGDGVMAVFADPVDALGASVAAQRALGEAQWPDEVQEIDVRMGVHTGYVEADATGDDLLGPTVNRAARIAAAAHGGQVLASSATRELCGDRAEGMSFRDLGEHQLRGIARAERVAQVLAAGLGTEFPPLRTEPSPTNVPARLTDLFGRTDELALASQLLDECRLLTVVGSGGVGKTTLAFEVGRRRRDRHPAGVWLVQLAGLTDGRRVATECLGAMRQPAAVDRDHLEVLVETLSGQQSLLIVDNCEHLLEDVAAVVVAVLEGCADVKFLVTSREPLHVPGERVWLLPTLSLPESPSPAAVESSDAGSLFVALARAADPSFHLTDDNSAHVADICERLDGLPLALELACARLRSMGIADLVRRLSDRFKVLTAAGAGLSHHRTLREAVAWSYELLSPSEQRLYRWLSVFAGGFDCDAAETVGGDGVLDALDHLVAQSLVQHHDGRFDMLETVRQYGLELLDELDERNAACRDHLAWLEQLARTGARQLEGPQQYDWLHRFQTEIDNVRAAFTWALDHDPVRGVTIASALTRFFWMNAMEATPSHAAGLRSFLDEGHAWATALLDAAGPDLPLKSRARLQTGIGGLLCVRSGRYEEAVDRLRDAIASFEAVGDARGRGWADFYDGVAGWSLRDPEETVDILQRARSTLHDAGDVAGESFSMLILGRALLAADRAGEGRPGVDELHGLVEGLNVPMLSAHAAELTVLYDAWEDTIDRHTVDEAIAAITSFREMHNYACMSHALEAVAMMVGRTRDVGAAGLITGLAIAIRKNLNLVFAPYEDSSAEVMAVLERSLDASVERDRSLRDEWQAAVARGLTMEADEGVDLVLGKLHTAGPGATWFEADSSHRSDRTRSRV